MDKINLSFLPPASLSSLSSRSLGEVVRIHLHAFTKLKETKEAVGKATSLMESKMEKEQKKFVEENTVKKSKIN